MDDGIVSGSVCSITCRDQQRAALRRQEQLGDLREAKGLDRQPPARPPGRNVWSASGELHAEAAKVAPMESPRLPDGVSEALLRMVDSPGGLKSVSELLTYFERA
jgi:hypothetical protein